MRQDLPNPLFCQRFLCIWQIHVSIDDIEKKRLCDPELLRTFEVVPQNCDLLFNLRNDTKTDPKPFGRLEDLGRVKSLMDLESDQVLDHCLNRIGNLNRVNIDGHLFGPETKQSMATQYPPCFEICGLAKQMYDELESKKNRPEFQRLMKLYSEVFCVEMGSKKIPTGQDPKAWLQSHFREGDGLVRKLGGSLSKHRQIESIHTPTILKMYRSGMSAGASLGLKFIEKARYNDVYFYFGHGATLCDAAGNLPLETVPINSALMSSSLCGINTSKNAARDFLTIYNFNLNLFKQVVLSKGRYKPLKTILAPRPVRMTTYFTENPSPEIYERNFVVSLPGETFVNGLFQAANANQGINLSQGRVVHPAGLYDMATLIDMVDQREQYIVKKSLDPEGMSLMRSSLVDFPSLYDVFLYIYGRSKWPGPDEIKHILTVDVMQSISDEGILQVFYERAPQGWDSVPTEDNVIFIYLADLIFGKKLLISQRDLMIQYPGIHIWDICRGYQGCNPDVEFRESVLGGHT